MASYAPVYGRRRTGVLAGLLGVVWQGVASAEPVDVELVLAADVSLSMSLEELEIQRSGYVAALTHESVVNAILDGMHGRIAFAMFEWAGEGAQYPVVPWTVIASREDAERVAAQIAAAPRNMARRTSISSALEYAADLIAESGYTGMRRVVDVSGDGPNNQGRPVLEAREALVSRGIVINGLPLMTNASTNGAFDLKDLDRYYTNCVIGGPGSFVIPVTDWEQFPEAVRRKLVLELAGVMPDIGFPVITVQAEQSYDCMVGEKHWLDRRWMWQEP